MNERLLSIAEAASAIGVSIKTLRRWDAIGKLKAVRHAPTGHRYYRKIDVDLFLNDIFVLAERWASNINTAKIEPQKEFYCPNSAVFQARLERLQSELAKLAGLQEIFPLVVAVAGEIGNNSFDHNLGNWPDVPGVFFAYDLKKREIVLADRGRGVRETLRRVRPDLANDNDALRVAFTEIVSGRAPEERGNGLKFVYRVVTQNPLYLFFQSGSAQLEIAQEMTSLDVRSTTSFFQGCVAHIKF